MTHRIRQSIGGLGLTIARTRFGIAIEILPDSRNPLTNTRLDTLLQARR